MEGYLLGGYAAFFCFGYLLASGRRQSGKAEQQPAPPSPEQEQLDRQWQALFAYCPNYEKEEFDEDTQ